MPGLEAAKLIANRFGHSEVPVLTSKSLKSNQFTASRLRTSGEKGTGLTKPLHVENAYVISTQLIPLHDNELWRAGKLEAKGSFLPGEIGIVNLRDEPTAYLPRPYDCVQFYIPGILLAELAANNEMPAITELNFMPSVPDRIIPGLAKAILPYLDNATETESLFFENVALAAYVHLARTYGSSRPPTKSAPGILSKAQLRMATELLAENIVEQKNSLEEIATSCGMPTERFVRAFKKSTGAPPHKWLRSLRVRRATSLISSSTLSLAEIAFACGFVDQAHMTKAFISILGVTPGTLRGT